MQYEKFEWLLWVPNIMIILDFGHTMEYTNIAFVAWIVLPLSCTHSGHIGTHANTDALWTLLHTFGYFPIYVLKSILYIFYSCLKYLAKVFENHILCDLNFFKLTLNASMMSMLEWIKVPCFLVSHSRDIVHFLHPIYWLSLWWYFNTWICSDMIWTVKIHLSSAWYLVQAMINNLTFA